MEFSQSNVTLAKWSDWISLGNEQERNEIWCYANCFKESNNFIFQNKNMINNKDKEYDSLEVQN